MDTECSERQERRTAFVACELCQYNIDIAALQETRHAGEGHLTDKGAGHTFFWEGKAENEQRIHGIGFAVISELIRNLEKLLDGINTCLMTLHLKLKSNELATVISAYAWTLQAEPGDKEILHSTLDSMQPQDHSPWWLQCSDRQRSLSMGNVVGKEGVGNGNYNGIELLTKCVEHQLVITNTLFHQENRNKTSWRHPRSPYWHMIDYVFEHCCDRKDILITKKMTSSHKCWINHRLVWSSISFVLRKQRKILKQQKFKHNLIKLEPSSIQNWMQHCYMLMTSMLNASGKILRLPLKLYVMKHWAARSGAVRTGLMTMT